MNEYRWRGSAAPVLRRVSGVATVAGAAFLTSGVWAIVAEVVSHAEPLRPPRSEDWPKGFEEGTGAGLWLVVVAVVAMVLTLRPTWHNPQSATRSPATSSPTMWRAS